MGLLPPGQIPEITRRRINAALGSLRVANVVEFGAKPDGETDNTAAFRRALESLDGSSGAIYVPTGRYYFDFTGADVINNPIVILQIETDNVFVYGDGAGTELILGGITVEDLNSGSNDPSAAGNDVATIINFEGVDGGGVRDLRFTGLADGSASITVGKARAKGVGVMNSRSLIISGVVGADIPGNAVNLRGNGGSPETSTSWCYVQATADRCAENGINLMGGTYRCQVAAISRRNSYHGLESGCEGLVGWVCGEENQRYAFANVGNGCDVTVISRDNVIGGVNLSYNSAQFASRGARVHGVLHETVGGAKGVVVNGRVHDWMCDADIYSDGSAITVNGDAQSDGCKRFTISGNRLEVIGGASTGVVITAPCSAFRVSAGRIVGGSGGINLSYTLAGGSPDYSSGSADVRSSDFEIVGTKFIGQTADAFVLRGVDFRVRGISTTMGGGATRSGQVIFADSYVLDADSLDLAPAISALAGPNRRVSCAFGAASYLRGSAAYDPPSVDPGLSDVTTVTVSGAQLGDRAEATFNLSLAGLLLSAYVSASNTVTCVFSNPTAGAVDLGAGTLKVVVTKR